MRSQVFDAISKYFQAREFERIPTDSENVNMVASYQKSSLYLVNIIELNKNYVFDKNKYLHYRELTKSQFQNINADQVILLNLLIVDDAESIYDEVNYPTEMDEDFIDIHWIVDLANNELIIPKNQLNNVIGLEKELAKIISLQDTSVIKLHKKNKIPIITATIIIINVIIWLLLEFESSSFNGATLIKYGALYTPLIQDGHEYWRLITSMFIHIGATHLLFNCFSLYIFGARLEKYLSSWQFIIIYLLSGLLGSIFSLVTNIYIGNLTISAGASGGIYGLIGSILVCSRLTGKSIDGLNTYSMLIFFIIGIVFGVVSPNIDSAAHIGGFIGGLLITQILLNRRSVSE